MRYALTTRPLSANDISKECPYLPEDEDADLHLSALSEDIQSLSAVKSVAKNGFVFTIELNDGTTHSEIKAAMRPLFSGERFCMFRFVSLDPH